MSKIPKKGRERHFKTIGDHQLFLERITRTLYYGKLPSTERLSLPVTELAVELFSEPQHGRSLDRLHCTDAAKISRNACVSPCSLVLAILYLEQLKTCNPEYLQRIAPSELFLVSLMVASKFLHDDGEDDEVFVDEWASSGGVAIKDLIQLEKEFLNAIQWEVYVHENKFWKKLKEIEKILAKKEGKERGWFTYTELQTIMMTIDVSNLIQCITAFVSILLTTYTLGVITLLGSFFIVSTIPGNCLQTKNVYMENKLHLPIEEKPSMNDSSNLPLNLDNLESDINDTSSLYQKPLNAADVLKTGIILASIKSTANLRRSYRTLFDSEQNTTETTANDEPFAWWLDPAMKWLTRSSKMIEDYSPDFKRFVYYKYTDMAISNRKLIQLEDQIHKATKVRIQEQMERSWHMEWTDSLRNIFTGHKLLAYF